MRILTNIRAQDVLDELVEYEEMELEAQSQANATLRRRRSAKAQAHGATATEAARKGPGAGGNGRLEQVSCASRATRPAARLKPEPVPAPMPEPMPEPAPVPSPTLLTPGELADYLTDLAKQRRVADPRREAKGYIQAARKCECLDPTCLTIRSLSRKQLDDVVRNVRG